MNKKEKKLVKKMIRKEFKKFFKVVLSDCECNCGEDKVVDENPPNVT